MACWLRLTGNPAVAKSAITIGQAANFATEFHYLGISSAGRVVAVSNHGATVGTATSTAGLTANTWFLAGVSFLGANSRSAWFNGASRADDTTSVGVNAIDQVQYPATIIADCCDFAVWDLTNWGANATQQQTNFGAALAEMAKGKSASFFRKGLKSFCKGIGRNAAAGVAEVDEYDALATTGGTLSFVDHPRIIYPKSGRTIRRIERITGSSGAVTFTVAGLSASGTETITGTASETLTVSALAASGTETISGTSTETITAPSISASGTETLSGSGTVTYPVSDLAASGTETISGTASETISVSGISANGIQVDVLGGGTTDIGCPAIAGSGSVTVPSVPDLIAVQAPIILPSLSAATLGAFSNEPLTTPSREWMDAWRAVIRQEDEDLIHLELL
jgi:hypothetical protein